MKDGIRYRETWEGQIHTMEWTYPEGYFERIPRPYVRVTMETDVPFEIVDVFYAPISERT